MTLTAEGPQVRGVLEVENSRTLLELQQATPPLIQRLAGSGIQLERLDLVFSDPGGQDSAGAGNSPLSYFTTARS